MYQVINLNLKNKILVTTAIAFVIIMIINNFAINYIKTQLIHKGMEEYNQDFQRTYESIQEGIHDHIDNKLDYIMQENDQVSIKEIFNPNTSYESSYNKLNTIFKGLQKQAPYIATLHIYDAKGISRVRAHRKGAYGDDLKSIRPMIQSLVQTPRDICFFELGVAGFYFRIVKPIYDATTLLGFIEIGIEPSVFLKKIKQFRGLESLFFIKKDFVLYNRHQSSHYQQIGEYVLYSKAKVDKQNFDLIPPSYHFEDDYKVIVNHETIMLHTLPIKDIYGNELGKILSFQNFSFTENLSQNVLIYVAFFSLTLFVIVLYFLNYNYTKVTQELDGYIYILDNIKDSIFVIDLHTHHIVFANKNAQKTLGYSKKELLNLRLEQFSIPLNVGDALICESNLEEIKKSHDSFIKRAYNRAKDGSITPVEISFSYVEMENQEYLVSICHSIKERLQLEQKDKANAKLLNRYIPISQTDLEGNITYVNDAFCKLTGYEAYELLGENHRILKDPATKESIYNKLWENISNDRVWNSVIKNIRQDGKMIWANITIEPMYDSFHKKIGYISTREDISDKKELEYISRHDPLTGAKNRRYFEQKLRLELEGRKVFGLIMFDIDHFKAVNDTYGHQVGDLVLKNLAKAIHTTISNDNLCARWGGEEFVILARTIDSVEDLIELTQQLQDAIAHTNFKPVTSVTSSFGLTLSKLKDDNESIQARVDKALYQAKESGRNCYKVL